MAIKSAGFIPHHRWNIDVPVGGEIPLGLLKLRRGASLSGWLVLEEGELQPLQTKTRLLPVSLPGGQTHIQKRLESFASAGKVQENGFFQLVGVAPGTYVLEMDHPGFATARVHPLDVWSESETFLKDSVVLRRPINLDVHLTPAVYDDGQPWRLMIHRISEHSASYEDEPVFVGSADENGLTVIPNLQPGDFAVQVSDGSAGQFFFKEFLGIGRESPSRIDIDIPIIWVAGQVSFKGEPVSGTLRFGGRHNVVRTMMEANADGEFEGLLPKEGTWRVEIEGREPEILKTEVEVEVAPNAEGDAFVEIRLPDTHLFGLVIDDETDIPVPSATIVAMNDNGDRPLMGETNVAGEFELRALPEGWVMVSANSRKMSGPRQRVEVRDGQPTGPVELRLRRHKQLKGRVVSERGAVPGSTLEVYPVVPALPFSDRGRTDFDGGFSVEVPDQAKTVSVTVSPPGHYLKVFEMPATADPVVLFVGRQGGELIVQLPYSNDQLMAGDLAPLVFQDGRVIMLQVLDAWSRGHGTRFFDPRTTTLHAPQLAPAEYVVCLSPRQQQTSENQPTPQLIAKSLCDKGYLAAGQTLHLEIEDQ